MTALATMMRGARNTFRSGTNITEQNIMRSLMVDGGHGIELSGGEWATFEHLYKTQPWIRAAIDRTAHSMGRLPMKVYIDAEQVNERTRVRDGALADLLDMPWQPGGNLTVGTQGEMLEAIVKNIAWHGNAVFVKSRRRPGEPPSELIPSNASYWSTRTVDGSLVYQFDPGNGQPKLPFFPEEVVHFKFWGTGKATWAPSPMESIRRTLMLEDAAQRAMISAFEHGMRQAGFFSAPKEMTEGQFQRLRAQMAENGSGPDRAFKTLLYDNGITWQAMSNNAEESQLIEIRKLNREEIAAAFGVSPPMVGILDRSTFNNIEELHLMMHDDLDVWATMIEQTLQAQLISMEPTMDGQYVEIDLNKILRGDPMKRMAAYASAVGGPWMTPNEARERENLPPADGGDALLSPLNSVPADARPA